MADEKVKKAITSVPVELEDGFIEKFRECEAGLRENKYETVKLWKAQGQRLNDYKEEYKKLNGGKKISNAKLAELCGVTEKTVGNYIAIEEFELLEPYLKDFESFRKLSAFSQNTLVYIAQMVETNKIKAQEILDSGVFPKYKVEEITKKLN
ncbi:MAG: hypothetical protein U9Q90_02855 [Campylobacterota bacterium]|nr:hypothetical protein [Campylobacterota bacterium]